jgi:hypothetical protein
VPPAQRALPVQQALVFKALQAQRVLPDRKVLKVFKV